MDQQSAIGGAGRGDIRAGRRSHVVKHGRIDPLLGPQGGWVLYYVPWGSRRGFTTTHRRLSSAKAWAAHYERLSVRRANRVRHGILSLVVTVVALALLVLCFATARWGPIVFISGASLAYLGLHELADLLDAVVPDDASDTASRWTARFDAWLGSLLERIGPTDAYRGGPQPDAGGDRDPAPG